MKIVAFEGQGGPRLGLIDGDQVVDLSAVDASVPADLGEWLRRHDGDLKPLADIAKRAGASARRPLAGLTYALPSRIPEKSSASGSIISSTSRKARNATISRNSRPSSCAA